MDLQGLRVLDQRRGVLVGQQRDTKFCGIAVLRERGEGAIGGR